MGSGVRINSECVPQVDPSAYSPSHSALQKGAVVGGGVLCRLLRRSKGVDAQTSLPNWDLRLMLVTVLAEPFSVEKPATQLPSEEQEGVFVFP